MIILYILLFLIWFIGAIFVGLGLAQFISIYKMFEGGIKFSDLFGIIIFAIFWPITVPLCYLPRR